MRRVLPDLDVLQMNLQSYKSIVICLFGLFQETTVVRGEKGSKHN